MNRPFYWHYLEKTGGVPNPMSLTLITDPDTAPEHIKGETIHFGSPVFIKFFNQRKILQAIFAYMKNRYFIKPANTFKALDWSECKNFLSM